MSAKTTCVKCRYLVGNGYCSARGVFVVPNAVNRCKVFTSRLR